MIGGPGKDQLWGSSWWRRGLFRWPRLSMIVFASRRFGRSHSFPVAWKWEHRRLEAVFISQTLSLSKKFERKSKEFEVGTYILLEIDWSERWEVEPWSEDKVWCKNWSSAIWGFWWFGGFEDLGVLKFLFDDLGENWSSAKIQICWGFHSSCYSRFGGFHFQKSLGAHQMISRTRRYWTVIFFMLISKVFMAVEIAQLKKCIFQRLLSKEVSNIIFLCLFQWFY